MGRKSLRKRMKNSMNLASLSRPLLVAISLALTLAAASAGDWPQWRGPNRSGYVESGPLVETLPSDGLRPVWKLDYFSGGGSGGWSSPVICGERVYVYSHAKSRMSNSKSVPAAKFPWLPPEKRTGMTDAEYEQYEVNRRDENEQQALAFRFDERLICLDLVSGDIIWQRKHDSKYTRFTHSGTPCVADGRIFVLGAERTARCYDESTGEVLWSKRLAGDFRDQFFSSSFAVDGMIAIVACGAVTALDVESGEVLWQGDEPLDYQSHSSPVIWNAGDESFAIVNTAGGKTNAYRLADGKKLWQISSGAGQSTPIIAGDLLLTYGSSRKNGLTAFRLLPETPEKQPEMAWRFQRAADSGSTPVVRGDSVFVQGDKRLAKVSLADGSTVWQTTMKISNPRYTSLIAAGDQVFYGWEGLLSFDAEGSEYHQLYNAEIDAESMLIGSDDLRKKLRLDQLQSDSDGLAKSEKIWQDNAVKSGPLGCATPALSEGRIVIRLRNGLVCYDLRR